MDALSFPILPISSQMGTRRNSHSSHTPYKGVGNGKRGGLGTGSTEELASRLLRSATTGDISLLPPNRIVQPGAGGRQVLGIRLPDRASPSVRSSTIHATGRGLAHGDRLRSADRAASGPSQYVKKKGGHK